MTQPTLLLSDLHLPPAPSPLRDTFLAFLRGPAREAAVVYILGDLFEYWIGDREGLETYPEECAALRELTRAGVTVRYQHGNRDFMVGKRFFAETGVDLLPDPVRIELAGKSTLLSHGDLFCSDDVGYQRWRYFSRKPAAQWVYRQLPRAWRQAVANGLRTQSDYKPAEIMDVNAGAITAAFRAHKVNRLIHGHTHRPGEHRVAVDGRDCERIVLADWRPGRREILRVEPSGVQRVLLPG